jgi:hypothetical protein
MRRLIPVLCLLALLPGCGGKPPADAGKTVEGGRPVLKENAGPAEIAAAYLTDVFGPCEVQSFKEHSTTLRSKPAVAVHVQWKARGENDLRSDVLVIQEGRVRGLEAYDTAKSFEENATFVVRQLETP